ncbi:MAG: gamma-glutamyl-gamma-aminobutyrate hydrolase family protein [Patescibacteria group bacterium]
MITIGIPYTGMFTAKNWQHLLDQLMPELKTITISSEMIEPLPELNFIIFDGGADVSPHLYNETPHATTLNNAKRDKIEWKIGQLYMNNPKTKFIGICRGHQFLNVLMGGTLYQDLRSIGLGHNSFHQNVRNEESKISKYTQDSYIPTNSYHHQAVKTLGNNLAISLREPSSGIVEGLESIDGDKIRSVQCHPEFAEFQHALTLLQYLFRLNE